MLITELVESFIQSRIPANGKVVVSKRTIEDYHMCLGKFTAFMADRGKDSWEQIIAKDVRAYMEYVKTNPAWSDATKLRYLLDLRTLCNFVERDEECRAENLKTWAGVIGKLPQCPSRKFIPAEKDLIAMDAKWKKNTPTGLRNHVVYNLIMSCGMRIGEICWLRMEHLQLQQQNIVVPIEGKTGSRVVNVDRRVCGLLQTWLRRRAKMRGAELPWVFLAKRGRQCNRNTFGSAFRKAQPASHEGRRVTPHVLRHAFGTYFLREGGNMEQLRLTMGHTNYATLQGYLHLAQAGSDAAKAELERISPANILRGRGNA